MEQLAARLVEAAIKNARRRQSQRLSRDISVSNREWSELTARANVVAVLREIAADMGGQDLMSADVRLYAEQLGGLADYIEKGAAELRGEGKDSDG